MIMVEFDRPNTNPQRPAGHYSAAHQPHHGSPHLHHLDRPSAHSTPSPPYQYAALPHLAAQQPSSAMRQTPTSYPSPASYPSPSMSAYQYPPQQAPPPTSRGSPYVQPTSINLPPIRLNPPAPQLSQPPHDGSPLLGSPLPPSMHGYYSHALPPPAVPHSHITSSPIHQPHRYPLPSVGNPERIMSGGRHKKEIKRRTKTGCLTCRKRRIKCDEGHPTCKNCQKSKRECLGYDPIFKAQPGPAAIQPAPSAGSTPLPALSASPNSYTYPLSAVGQSYPQPLSNAASSPASSCDTYDYHPQIDPALDSATSHPHISAPPSVLDSQPTYRPELKRPLDRTSPFSSASDTGTNRTPYTSIPRSSTPVMGRHQDVQGNQAKRIKIDDLLSVGSSQPLSPPTSDLATNVSPTSNSVESMKSIYGSRYAPALDGFLEVSWFANSGMRTIRCDSPLAELMAEVFERFKARGGSYYQEEDPTIRKGSRDTDLLWATVKLCYGTRIPVSDNRRDVDERSIEGAMKDEGTEAYRRIRTIETLLSARSECNPASPRLPPSDRSSSAARGGQFWYLLEQIANFKVNGGDSERGLQALLDDCDKHVNGRPNRELLQAIAEVQFLGGEAAKPRLEAWKKYIQRIATDRSLPLDCLDRRIAGRAMGLWTAPVTELAFCMPAV